MGRQVKVLPSEKRAAVAALLRYDQPNRPSVLLMRRAESPGDRWSGHISFPGGKEEAQDQTLLDTAVRETREELGVELQQCSRFLGPLDPVHAMSKGQVLQTVIWPFVFVQTQAPDLRLGEEAAHAFWLPLAQALSGALDSNYIYDPQGAQISLPCWRYQGEVIWGLTFKMLQSLLALVRDDSRE